MKIVRFILCGVLSIAAVACNASPGPNRTKPGEVGSPNNLALSSAATQSSTGFGGDPYRAIDGNTDGRYFDSQSVTHTLKEQQPWWQVDLGNSKKLNEVRIWNRTDCCSERLSDWYVLTSNDPLPDSLSQALSISGVSSVHVAHEAESPSSITLPAGTTARYVRVWLNADDFLSLAEVEIFGLVTSPPSSPPASPPPASPPPASPPPASPPPASPPPPATPPPPPPTNPPPPATNQTLSKVDILYFAGGEHQSLAGWANFKNGGDPWAPNFGLYPTAPSNYDWAYAAHAVTTVPNGALGRQAGVGYNQLYEQKPDRNPSKNTRVKYGAMDAQYFSKSQQKWIRISRQVIQGAAFPEDFREDITPPTGGDFRDDGGDTRSIRAGSQANGDAGSVINRPLDGSSSTQRYNYHGFMLNRFSIDWNDVEAFVLQQWAGLVLDDPNGPDDRAQSGYTYNIGLDFWDTLSSPYDGFKTHGGVGGGRFVQVGIEPKRYICYVGTAATLDKAMPEGLPSY